MRESCRHEVSPRLAHRERHRPRLRGTCPALLTDDSTAIPVRRDDEARRRRQTATDPEEPASPYGSRSACPARTLAVNSS
ncbi:hypothetical protein STTU_4378 [Streptomyces sp. Tu6071]|nr:hypothetical protein STTU_4378 [Streptomyces sp. Tu6071]